MSSATDYSKLKVADLKDLLKSRSLSLSGLKADLVARLIQADEALTASSDQTQQAAVEEQQQQADEPATNGKRPVDHVDEAMNDAPAEGDAKRQRVNSPPPPSPSAPTAAPSSPPQEQPAPAPTPASPLPDVPTLIATSSQPIITPALPTVPIVDDPQAAAQAEVEAPNGTAQDGEDEEDGWVDYEAQFRAEQEAEKAKNGELIDGGGRPKDLYLDTISRPLLDFDFERLCSVTLTHNHIYCCLVCGRYYSGRGRSSPAYAHSIGEDHHVYINLETQKVYVLPDGYEVDDPSLADIKYALNPVFTRELVERLDKNVKPYQDLAQKSYYPGFVGLNNMKSNSYMNAILHSLVHVPPIRDYFLLTPLDAFPHPSSLSGPTELVTRFASFTRKVWNPRLFKAQVSPHELLQEVGNRSEGKFRITEAGDPVEFLGWLLNTLHRDLGGSKKPKSSIIYATFQGQLRVDDQQILKARVTDKQELRDGAGTRFDVDREIKSTSTPFLFLALDLPPPPLFQSTSTSIIPQVPLSVVLQKYDGITAREEKGVLRKWKVEKLPPFVIMVYKRFLSNRFLEEKNPTIVNFGTRGVEMGDYVDSTSPLSTVYDLVSNLTHSTTAGTAASETAWKVHVHLRPPRDAKTGELDVKKGVREEDCRWFEVCDLDVGEVEEGLVPLGETYIQIWERRTPSASHTVLTPGPGSVAPADPGAEVITVEVPKGKKGGKFATVGGGTKGGQGEKGEKGGDKK